MLVRYTELNRGRLTPQYSPIAIYDEARERQLHSGH